MHNKLQKLINRYKKYILLALFIAIGSIVGALTIYGIVDESHVVWHKVADLLRSFGETLIGAGLIGGGIGGGINFLLEEIKEEEEQAKEEQKKAEEEAKEMRQKREEDAEKRRKEYQEKKEKRKLFRLEMQEKLQVVHDHTELARILIKSHKSGRTYGEQIRNRIMPSLISLEEIRRGLEHAEDQRLEGNVLYLRVSLFYMIAYLSVLIEEFEASYLTISNLQTYQDAWADKMRGLFTDIVEGKKGEITSLKKKEKFLEKAEALFESDHVPANIEVVWQEIEKLDYVWDFINELRNEKGERSLYNRYFLQHYKHCNKMLQTRNSDINEKLTLRKTFKANMETLKHIDKKLAEDNPLSFQDNLTHVIMEKELRFDFEQNKMIKKEDEAGPPNSTQQTGANN